MELIKNALDAFEPTDSIVLSQEETAETIVPDYCPDIARIVKTSGQLYLHSHQIRSGKVELSGTIRIRVLYTPDGEKGLRTLEFAMPFTAESDRQTFSKCITTLSAPEIVSLDTKLLNPRKIFTRCKIMIRVTGYQKSQLSFCTDIEASPELSIQKKLTKETIVLLSAIEEKDFSFTDEISISASRKGASELLSNSVFPVITDTKIIGNKVICKGMFHITFLYRDADGLYESSEAELPFSQVLETEKISETALPEVYIQLTGADLQISGDDPNGRVISATFYLHATAFLYQSQEITLLEDLYSTSYHLTYNAETLNLTAFRNYIQRRQTMREILEIGVVAESILTLSVHCGSVSAGKDGKNVALRVPVTIRALYRDEGGTVLSAERTVESVCFMETGEDLQIIADANCFGEIQSSIGERGIEIRFPVDFSIHTEKKVRKITIETIHLEGDAQKDNAPSLVLRCFGKQEQLWDIAKQYRTTTDAILAANGLGGEEEIPCDKLLLIPKKRA